MLAQTLQLLTHRFELIIVDMFPVEVHPSPIFESTASCPVDMAVVVRDTRSTDEDQTVEAVQKLRDAGVKAVGVAENYGET